MASKVFYSKASASEGEKAISDKARKLFNKGKFASCFAENDFTAIKVHVGEAGNVTYLKAPYIKGLVDELVALKTRAFLCDTSILYSGRRRNAVDHVVLAAEHGYCADVLGVPFLTVDGIFGTFDTPVEVNGEINKEVFIASDLVRCQSLLSVAHFTGHPMACAGATLKTLGMGCAGKKGKMHQHSSLKLFIDEDCTLCGLCAEHCPAEAITLGKKMAKIDHEKCIGCGECLAVCRFGAVKCDWVMETTQLQKGVAEYAAGAVKGKKGKAAFFNFLLSVTKDCDCFDNPDVSIIVDDIGILASADPVAVDKAAVDLVEKATGKKMGQLLANDELDPRIQIDHAESLGVGSADYELVEVK